MPLAMSSAAPNLLRTTVPMSSLKRWQGLHDLDRLDADADDLADEADDVFFVVGVVGVAGDAAAFVGADLVLVDDPIERAAVAEAVVEDLGRDFAERERLVDLEDFLSLESLIFSTW